MERKLESVKKKLGLEEKFGGILRDQLRRLDTFGFILVFTGIAKPKINCNEDNI